MPTTYVALLRGINVGGNNVLRMTDLRRVVEKIGGTGVATYIQSGNVVFDHASRSPSKLTAELALAIGKAMRAKQVSLVLRTARELADVLADNPFAAEPADHLHVMLLARRVPAEKLSSIAPDAWGSQQFALVARELYLYLPDGVGNSKLVAALLRHAALAAGTIRNWRTLRAIAELTATDRS